MSFPCQPPDYSSTRLPCHYSIAPNSDAMLTRVQYNVILLVRCHATIVLATVSYCCGKLRQAAACCATQCHAMLCDATVDKVYFCLLQITDTIIEGTRRAALPPPTHTRKEDGTRCVHQHTMLAPALLTLHLDREARPLDSLEHGQDDWRRAGATTQQGAGRLQSATARWSAVQVRHTHHTTPHHTPNKCTPQTHKHNQHHQPQGLRSAIASTNN